MIGSAMRRLSDRPKTASVPCSEHQRNHTADPHELVAVAVAVGAFLASITLAFGFIPGSYSSVTACRCSGRVPVSAALPTWVPHFP